MNPFGEVEKMNTGAVSSMGQSAIQAYQLSGRIEYESYEYARVSSSSGPGGMTDVLELGRGEKITVEFSLSILQERTQSKIDARFPESSGIGLPFDPNLDTSPGATAQRIVDFATGFFGVFRGQHTEMSDQEALNAFMDLIGGAIDEGFAQAREIIESLNAMTSELGDTIGQTYDLVQDKLQSFYDMIMEQLQAGGEAVDNMEVMAA